MPIKKEAWIIECDNCGERFAIDDSVGWSAYDSEEDAKQAIGDDGGYWTINSNGRILCEECQPCPECGNEERGQGGYLTCECPATVQ